MSNQDRILSDEELLKKLEEECDAVFRTAIALNSGKSIKEAAKDIFDLINTQKRLYAESVIGEDEKLVMEDDEGLFEHIRNTLRAEQRARIK